MQHKSPTAWLTEEHNTIKEMLEILGKVCDKLESGTDIDHSHISGIIEFIQVFADKYHHGKEENLLFRAMVDSGFPEKQGPIAVMLSEHDIGRGYVSEMSAALTLYRDGKKEAADTLIEQGRNFITLLVQHIHKEDNILYPMADRQLTDDQQSSLIEGFEAVNRELIGAEKLNELHQTLQELKAVYLDQ